MSKYTGRPQTTRKKVLEALHQINEPTHVTRVLDVMCQLGWDDTIENPLGAVAACLSRLWREGIVERPERGIYQYAVSRAGHPAITRERAIADLHDAVETVLAMSAPRTARVRVTIDITED